MQSWQRHPTLFALVTVLGAVALVVPAAASAWTWPVSGPVLRGFLFSEDTPLAPGQHRGIDIQGALGDSVLAPSGGTVTFVGRVAANGLTVTIETRDGYTVTLLHLGASLVARGAVVAEGQPVATVGTSGVPEYSVPYVQLGVRLSSDPEGYVDPQVFLPPLAPPSLPPTPTPDSQPAPAVPPAPATPPPTVVPPVTGNRPALRATAHGPGAPNRPTAAPDVRRVTTSTSEPSAALIGPHAHAPSSAAVATTGAGRAPAQHPLDTNSLRASAAPTAAGREPAPLESGAPAPEANWIRPLDPVTRLVAGTASHGERGSVAPSRDVLILLVALLAASSLCAYEVRRRAARIIGGDALLPDDADLLRELEPAHRARVHDDRRGRARPAPQAAR